MRNLSQGEGLLLEWGNYECLRTPDMDELLRLVGGPQ